ncbi:MAG: hypothetical protein AB8E82_04905 [Aureispira sp.]
MKKSIIIGGVLFLLLAVLPYSMQLYGRRQLAVSLEQPNFDLTGYQKGWNCLEYMQYFPFWQSETKKYQRYGLLKAKMRFFEEWADCQVEADTMLEVWADKRRPYISSFDAVSITEQSFSRQLLYWEVGEVPLDSLSERLQERIVIFSDHYCVDNRKKWKPFVDWTIEKGIDLVAQDSILPIHALREHIIQLKIDCTVNYITKGYSLW